MHGRWRRGDAAGVKKLWRHGPPVLLAALVSAGVVSSGADGGRHHRRNWAEWWGSWALMSGSALAVSWAVGEGRRRWRRRPAAGEAGGAVSGGAAPRPALTTAELLARNPAPANTPG
jgi:hypothetical protein